MCIQAKHFWCLNNNELFFYSFFIRVVAEDWCEPLLSLIELLSLATGIVLHLVTADLLHGEVVCIRVSKVEATDRAGWVHGERLGQLDTCLLFDLHQIPHSSLLCVIWLRWVARSGSDALVLHVEALSWRQLLIRGVSPELFPDDHM